MKAEDNLYRFPSKAGGEQKEKNSTSDKLKGSDSVDWQEKYIEKLNQDVTEIKNDIKTLEDKLGDKVTAKLEEFRSEMRHLDNQRAEDMREIRNSLESTNRHVQGMSSNVHSIAIATIIGVAAMVIAVVGIWYSVSSSQNDINKQLQQQTLQIQEIKNKQQKE